MIVECYIVRRTYIQEVGHAKLEHAISVRNSAQINLIFNPRYSEKFLLSMRAAGTNDSKCRHDITSWNNRARTGHHSEIVYVYTA